MQRSLLLPQVPSASGASHSAGLPVLAKGFRPFFWLAALYAIAIVPLWLAILNGALAAGRYLEPSVWHAHEMLGGFTTAVIAGFLLTAVGNWTQRETAVGPALGGLSAVWIAGRISMLFAGVLPHGVAALVDLAFVPLLALTLARPLVASKSRRNFVMLGLLGALFTTNVFVHLEGLGIVAHGAGRTANLVALDLIALLMLLIAGRVFPMFTRNATGAATIRSHPLLDRACMASMALLCLVDAFGARESRLALLLAGLVGALAVLRAVHWGTVHSRRAPLLWILHKGYFWLAFGLLIRAAGPWIGIPFESVSTHAITVGAIGSLTLGMMARVSLGHTGRMLAAPRPMFAAFVAIGFAALFRVFGPWLAPQFYREALIATAACWVLAFGIFLVVYTPILLRPRVDGRPG